MTNDQPFASLMRYLEEEHEAISNHDIDAVAIAMLCNQQDEPEDDDGLGACRGIMLCLAIYAGLIVLLGFVLWTSHR